MVPDIRCSWCGRGYSYCSSPACQLEHSDSCDGNIRPRGQGTETIPRPKVGLVPYGEGIYRCEVYGGIALSFDDGPYTHTEHILDLLALYQAKATFFVTGRNFGKGAINDPNTPWPALIKRMVADGHQVASHTWSHQRLTDLGWRAFHQQIIYNEIALANILGFFPTYLRPPYSASNERTDRWLGELGYHVTYFNLDTKGYLHDSPGLIQESKNIWDENVDGRNPTETTWLGVEHDPIYQTAHNLTKHMLESLYKNGFRAVTVGECLGDPKEYWYRNLFDS
ncbi:putative chitin binding protein [Drechmeria coniospora]|uniref:Putative chitin binding protein n=1 Tax=Drechmeria coniospora TaxID=98403 RepID=A0A151GJU6_DRECN|nr:putative chitin binding protein [Drechmeria coniospora]KYK57403.1 putative chitin binding protein [Drechmeria coniospora]